MKRILPNGKKFITSLRKGDLVMVLGGGNQRKEKVLRGKTGSILRFLPKKHRVVVEGVNVIKRHKRAASANESGGIIEREGSLPISQVMFYSEELGRPVRLKIGRSENGRKVRGFVNPKTRKFEHID